MSKDLHHFEIPRDELHESLGGGFPKGSLLLIEGTEGTGKSALNQRFLYGLLENRNSVTFVSTELTTKEFVDQMYSLNYPVSTFILHDNLLFVPVYPLFGRMSPKMNFIHKLMNARTIFKSDVIIIDTLSGLLTGHETDEEVRALVGFFKKLSMHDKTIVITADPTKIRDDVMRVFRETCSIYLTLEIKIIGSYIRRNIHVKRFLKTKHTFEEIVGFRMEPGTGLIVEITTLV